MVNNIADVIQEYIEGQLAKTTDGQVELKRTELANIISCAPSQISYVLSTRFASQKKYIVESRRGLGGYIRITLITAEEDEDDEVDEVTKIYEDMVNKIKENSKFKYVKSMIDYLLENKMVTKREAELCAQFIFNLYNDRTLDGKSRTKLIRSVFITLSKMATIGNR